MTDIVVDLGCHTHGDQESIRTLIQRFHPKLLLGFDPHPQTQETVETIDGTVVVISRKAAATSSGTRNLHVDGTRTQLAADGDETANTFDLAALLLALPNVAIVLKLDVEGAEYDLLPRLHIQKADWKLHLILVEWHGDPLPLDLACPVEEWQ